MCPGCGEAGPGGGMSPSGCGESESPTLIWSKEKRRFDDAYKQYRDDGLPDWSGRVAKAVGTRSKAQVRSRATNQIQKLKQSASPAAPTASRRH